MRKRELISTIAREVDLPPRDVTKVLDALFGHMADVLVEEQRFEITGFGVFNIRELKERRTYVPKRKEIVTVPARRVLRFHEASELRERLNTHGGRDD